ncbi:hypothetical protein [Gluconacetobacter azotocaptans]|nr:hypothetical protein [Gluconacetobacter azotocaptans]
MTDILARRLSTTRGHSIGYWSVMIVGIAGIIALYACALIFGAAW